MHVWLGGLQGMGVEGLLVSGFGTKGLGGFMSSGFNFQAKPIA